MLHFKHFRHLFIIGMAVGVGLSSFTSVYAQDTEGKDSGIQLKIVNDKIYMYETTNPKELYPVTDEEAGRMGFARPGASINTDKSIENRKFAPNYNYQYMPAPIAPRPAEANTALPSITFRDPYYAQQEQGRLPNPIGGLPRYPGKKY